MLIFESFFDPTFVPNLKALRGEEKRSLLRMFWPNSRFDLYGLDESPYSEFLEFVANELQQIQRYRTSFAAQNLDSTFAIIQKIRDNRHKACGEIVRDLSSQFVNFDPIAIRRSLELSTRLWLSLNTRSSDISVGPVFVGEASVEWDVNISLDVLLQKHFANRNQGPSLKEYGKFDPTVTAAYLVSACGMRLLWTDDIASHLKFDLDRLVLSVYRHKICLINHLENQDGYPIPEDLLGEILDTMNLLFPFGDMATKQLLMKEGQKSMYTLGSCNRSRRLDLAHYRYFGEELQHLIGFFDKTPRTWKQLAFDRRNKLEWSAFWVTIMVALLTVISIPCNIIQATYSVKAYHVALAQGNNAVRAEL